MRPDFQSPIRFGDDLTAERYMRRVQAALAQQRTRWAVAPDISVLLPNGARLAAGSAVTLPMMAGATPSPEQHIRRLVEQGYILQTDDGPQAA